MTGETLRRSVAADCNATAHVIEIRTRSRLAAAVPREGCSSLFTYCTHVLHLSDHAAYRRITAARLARRAPLRLAGDCVKAKQATLSAVVECAEDAGSRKTVNAPGCTFNRRRKISEHPALPDSTVHSPARPSMIAPLAPERYKIQFTASCELHDKLPRAQDLRRHTIPDGDVAAVVGRALSLLVEELEGRKLAAAARPCPPQSLSGGSQLPSDAAPPD